jgi:thiol-disulfide isomerase/thioredoxin
VIGGYDSYSQKFASPEMIGPLGIKADNPGTGSPQNMKNFNSRKPGNVPEGIADSNLSPIVNVPASLIGAPGAMGGALGGAPAAMGGAPGAMGGAPAAMGGEGYEVHFVYAEWCGHSKRSKPAMMELSNDNSIKSLSGRPIKFVMTPDTSELAKSMKVTGYPTYKVKDLKTGVLSDFNAGDRSKMAITTEARKLA